MNDYQVPQGYVLMPVNPSVSMREALQVGTGINFRETRRVYAQLIAAAAQQDQPIQTLHEEVAALLPQPIAWGAFCVGGKRDGKLYSHRETEDEIKQYISLFHMGDDTSTLRAGPLYTKPVHHQVEPAVHSQEQIRAAQEINKVNHHGAQ